MDVKMKHGPSLPYLMQKVLIVNERRFKNPSRGNENIEKPYVKNKPFSLVQETSML
jgi:hypothetical protein